VGENFHILATNKVEMEMIQRRLFWKKNKWGPSPYIMRNLYHQFIIKNKIKNKFIISSSLMNE
jgi:hypothetical protein